MDFPFRNKNKILFSNIQYSSKILNINHSVLINAYKTIKETICSWKYFDC